MSRRGSFNSDAFYASLDLRRAEDGLTWKDVAEIAGISASTLTRMKQGKRPDVDSMAALAAWARLDIDDYVSTADDDPSASEPLPKISALLRADPNLSGEDAAAMEELIRLTYRRLKGVKR